MCTPAQRLHPLPDSSHCLFTSIWMSNRHPKACLTLQFGVLALAVNLPQLPFPCLRTSQFQSICSGQNPGLLSLKLRIWSASIFCQLTFKINSQSTLTIPLSSRLPSRTWITAMATHPPLASSRPVSLFPLLALCSLFLTQQSEAAY